MTKREWAFLALFFIVLLALIYAIVAQEPPAIEKSVVVRLDVRAAPDFTLAVDPNVVISYPSRTVAYSITLTPVNEFAGEIMVSATGLPADFTVSYFPSNVVTVGGGLAGIQMTIGIPKTAAVRIHDVTVIARSEKYN